MARSLSAAAAFTASLSSGAKLAINMRGYAGAAAAAAGRSGAEDKMLRKNKVKAGGDAAAGSTAAAPPANSWIPDPVTGYYSPANRRTEVDAAELRKNLLSQK